MSGPVSFCGPRLMALHQRLCRWCSAFVVCKLTTLWSAPLVTVWLPGVHACAHCRLTPAEQREITRRKLLWMFYLIRSPFFEAFTR